ncbi:MAG: hypothetical protein R6X25_05330 [Candidatus Krumholzibacteriia bacterium]
MRRTTTLAAWWRPAAGWRLDVQATLRQRERRVWSEEEPWRPAGTEPEQQQTVELVRVRRRSGPWELRGDLRSVSDRRESPARTRRLVAAAVRWRGPSGWEIVGETTSAWGDPVDLLTVWAAAPGRILTRHWGQWRAGWSVGVTRKGSAWRWHGAVLWRRPEPAAQVADERTMVIGSELRW